MYAARQLAWCIGSAQSAGAAAGSRAGYQHGLWQMAESYYNTIQAGGVMQEVQSHKHCTPVRRIRITHEREDRGISPGLAN